MVQKHLHYVKSIKRVFWIWREYNKKKYQIKMGKHNILSVNSLWRWWEKTENKFKSGSRCPSTSRKGKTVKIQFFWKANYLSVSWKIFMKYLLSLFIKFKFLVMVIRFRSILSLDFSLQWIPVMLGDRNFQKTSR